MIIDTTYLLPLARIEVPVDIFSAILDNKLTIEIRSLAINLISIFELQAKATKLGIPPVHVLKAVQFIMKYLRIHNFWDKDIVETSFELGKLIPDYIDCIILATAIEKDNTLLTEDTRILKVKQHIEEQYGIEIITYNELLRKHS